MSDGKLISSESVDRKLKAATSHQRLASRIKDFNQQSSRYIYTDEADEANEANDLNTQETSDFEDDADLSVSTAVTPESMLLNLPSTLGRDKCEALGIKSLACKELRLRRGQANDTLHQLHVELGYKAFIH